MSDRLFKVDESGTPLFYPWGSLGKGYIVKDKKTEAKIRNFIAYYYVCLFILMAAFVFAGYAYYLFILLLPVFIVWEIGTRALTKTLVATEIRLTFSESMKLFARARNRVTLLLTAVLSLIFLILSVKTFLSHRSFWLGLAVVFFIVMALGNWYVFKLKDN
jgi:hypothetical protein